MNYTYLDTPIGELLLAGDENALAPSSVSPDGPKRRRAEPGWELRDTIFAEAKSQLNDYFAGSLREFSLALQPSGTAVSVERARRVAENPLWRDGYVRRDCCTPWQATGDARRGCGKWQETRSL